MSEEKKIRTLFGRVVSDKRNKSRTVVVEWAKRHEIYEKVMRKTTKYHIHDENNESHAGDIVEIKQIKPVSKTKAWALVKVVEAAK